VRVLADGQTHRQTDRQTQTDFIICPMLYAIAMGQINMYNGNKRPMGCDAQLKRTSEYKCAVSISRVIDSYLLTVLHTYCSVSRSIYKPCKIFTMRQFPENIHLQ